MNNYNPNIMRSFRFPISWKSIFRVLDLEDRAVLLNWIFWFCFEEIYPEEDERFKQFNDDEPVVRAWYEIRDSIEEQMDSWENYCKRKNEND